MQVKLNQTDKVKRNEFVLIFHPKNKELANMTKKMIEAKAGEVEVRDEFHNHFFISLLNIYYFEVIDHKVFAYTKSDVYRIHVIFHDLKKEMKTKGFIQINVRTLVNERHIYKYEMTKGCRRKLFLDNEECLVSNRQFKDNVDQMLKRRHVEEL